MLDGFRMQIDGHVDTMAERVVQLGGTALGTAQTVVQSTTLSPYPTDIYAIKEHLAALIERYGKVANSLRHAIDEADEAGDAVRRVSSPPHRAISTRRCGSWKRTSRMRPDG